MSDDGLRGLLAGMDAIGDADAVVGAAGQAEGRKFCQRTFDSSYARPVADVVLRHRVGMAPNTREQWSCGYAEQARQFLANIFFHDRIVIVEQFALKTAADESAQQNLVSRGAVRIFETAERASHYFASLASGNNEAKAVQLTWEILVAIPQINRCS